MAIQGLQDYELPEEPPSDIEDGIRPLVEKINQTRWMRTRQSCEGHPEDEIGPWVWVELHFRWLDLLFGLVDDVNKQLGDWLIHCSYIGQEGNTYWFEIRGRYIRPEVSQQMVDLLIRNL
jgi:hypothetical protein